MWPNRAESHGDHDVLPNVTGICDTCHDGFGTETAQHFDDSEPADVSVLSVYDAMSGTASYDPADMRCNDVSCHGGQTTPDWQTGVIDVDAACESCHELGASQFNSYNSGRHDEHISFFGIDCTQCHDTARLATSHFIGLDTPGFEGDPAETLLSAVNYNPPSCNPGSLPGCHLRRIGWN
jgi:predicted CxxxxCH...CXXCH cytochrome family protein